MEKIASFTIDHDVLVPGLYVSRVDMGDIITYDLRFKRPNDGHPLDAAAAHTVEHIFATYLRSSEIADKVVYFGPMGCLTGFYMILKGAAHGEAIKAVKDAALFTANYDGEIPGGRKCECGNYRMHDLPGAKRECGAYYLAIRNNSEKDLSYPVR